MFVDQLRLSVATQKRRFTLAEDWEIEFQNISAPTELNATVVIPREHHGEVVDYDGASVPMPWLVSFISMGALRPLGVMLIPSIVHDFAFRFGELVVKDRDDGTLRVVRIERHDSDKLFYNMIRTVNGDVVTATLAWLAVRLGWLFGVRYDGKRFGGRPPLKAGFFAGMLVAAGGLLAWTKATWMPWAADRVISHVLLPLGMDRNSIADTSVAASLILLVFAAFYLVLWFLIHRTSERFT